MSLLAIIYVFTAGMVLGQLLMFAKPNETFELSWIIGIILATVLWPIFITLGLLIHWRNWRDRKNGEA